MTDNWSNLEWPLLKGISKKKESGKSGLWSIVALILATMVNILVQIKSMKITNLTIIWVNFRANFI